VSRKGQFGRRIEFHSHPKYGGNVPIYLDHVGTFRAVIGDVVLTANTKVELIRLTDESLKSQTDLKWLPIIEINFGSHFSYREDPDRNSSSVEADLEYNRYWIAQKIDKHWIKASWDVEHWPDYNKPKKIEVGDRLERSKSFDLTKYDRTTHEHQQITDLKLPYIVKAEDRDETPTYYVEYSEELWTALGAITKRMRELQARIIEVLKTPESRALLVADVSHLLPAPKKRGD